MCSLLRLVSLCASTLILTACGLSARLDGEGEGEGAEENAGEELGGDCDGGPCTDGETPRERDCGQLVIATCGAVNECNDDPGCVAANLLSEFRPADCGAALTDVRSYPRCSSSSCEQLVERVCGLDNGCASSAACAPARQLLERADAGDNDAAASCAAALTDETLFPLCRP